MLILAFVPQGAHAASVQFTCETEDAANRAAQAIVENNDASLNTARPFLSSGECFYSEDKIFVYIVKKGETFGTDHKITVLGLNKTENGGMPTIWAIIPAEEILADGSI